MGAQSSSADDEFADGSPGLPRLFSDASLYERFLNDGGSVERLGHLKHEHDSQVVKGFTDLVAVDLESDSKAKAITDRFAKLAVTGDSWPGPFAEPESYEPDVDMEKYSQDDGEEDGSRPLTPPNASRSLTIDREAPKLTPDEIIDLLVQEFGPLAAEGEEERLIIESDAAWIHDVVILGVIHLTTHRLTFHASLLSSRPDLSPEQQVIKAGPATIHRKGWRRSSKVWLELSHDVLSSYASSHDSDHIRPIRSVLFSSITKVLPMDPKHPRIVQIDFQNIPAMNGYAEFDTEESAHDWRREIAGALFLYRHRRREFMVGGSSEDLDGVRMCIPLSQIDRVDEGHCLTFTYFLSIYLPPPPPHVLDSSNETILNKLQFCTIRATTEWKQLQNYIDAAKRQQRPDKLSLAVFDFGPLTFANGSNMGANMANLTNDREAAVRIALGIDNESTIWIARARMGRRGMAAAGDFVVSPHFVGFWSKLYTQRSIRYRLPMSIIKEAKAASSNIFQRNGLSLVLEGQGDLQFDFKTPERRDQAVQIINAAMDTQLALDSLSMSQSIPSTITHISSFSGDELSYPSRSSTYYATAILAPLSRTMATITAAGDPDGLRKFMPKVINLPRGILLARPSMHFMCLTIGSRGDVQPYIALGLGLKKEGHRVTIVTHEEYKGWVEEFGIGHRTVGGDPGALMKLSVEHKMFSPEFFKESLTNFRQWLDDLLVDAWEQCQGAQVLLESPSAMAGVHIAEALNIPYFRCFTMPWTKTADFPHAFLSPPIEAPTFNSASYVLFDNVMWTATSGQINRWRRNTLKIGNTDMGHLAQSKITFIYNFSQAVVPKPLDWTDTIIVSGYWFLDNPDLNWTPPPSLLEWMVKAKADEKPIVYIGFGSITVPNPHKVTETIIAAVMKSGVRAIISKGWSARMNKQVDEPEVTIPPECYQLDKVPHDWLFPQIDAALHHGGAGTTGASLRAGIPTIIKPWFGDQYFWASRVHKLGAGLKVTNLRVNDLADALTKATTSRVMKEKAASVGERIRSENGVHTAIHAIYTYMDRASLDRTSLE